MYVQWFIKGISSEDAEGDLVLGAEDAFDLISSGEGIRSNWLRAKDKVYPAEVQKVLTPANLERHVHDYDTFGGDSPFISVTSGSVRRDELGSQNSIYSAFDIALGFATSWFRCSGALFYGWLPVSPNPAVEISSVAEAIRDLHVYHRWSPYQLEGEVTAKVNIPANQIRRVEWWDPSESTDKPTESRLNGNFVQPKPLLNHRVYL